MVDPLKPAQAVRALRDATGLTWDQFSRLLGVNIRTVHSWAAGGQAGSVNVEKLVQLQKVVDRLPGRTPEERRANLLEPDKQGQSIFDRLRSENWSTGATINPSLPVEVLLGGIR